MCNDAKLLQNIHQQALDARSTNCPKNLGSRPSRSDGPRLRPCMTVRRVTLTSPHGRRYLLYVTRGRDRPDRAIQAACLRWTNAFLDPSIAHEMVCVSVEQRVAPKNPPTLVAPCPAPSCRHSAPYNLYPGVSSWHRQPKDPPASRWRATSTGRNLG
ncbi:hypothetical protein PLICRDRAFT_335049 [Plicaturopsis crispa FD-325 SS-3]|uniref:Uncharacterized protein n=1 Tax=Plicaturopsis crispa FD-325 SS-3 TaxID=944288 RepID=A0A0C9T7A4_PLICR|nr:hypothetical protein PLICRDRAFT_335049 [Plicaturopsis crispa FD-325 SS-3]